jgi:hypothetical protein
MIFLSTPLFSHWTIPLNGPEDGLRGTVPDFFSQIKERQHIGRKASIESIRAILRRMRGLVIFVLSSNEL